MNMQLWELKENVDKMVERNGDGATINAYIELKENPSGSLSVLVNEVEI